jgi:hypothetical protein
MRLGATAGSSPVALVDGGSEVVTAEVVVETAVVVVVVTDTVPGS